MDTTLEKPWQDLKTYAEARREESVVEVKVALALLANGYVRNAAGRRSKPSGPT